MDSNRKTPEPAIRIPIYAHLASEPAFPKCVFTPKTGFPFGFESQNTAACNPSSDLCPHRRATGTSEVRLQPEGGIPNWLRIAKHRTLRTASRSLTNKPQNRCICARRKRHSTIGFESQNPAASDPYSDLCQTRRGTGTSEVRHHPDGWIPIWLRIAKHRSLRSVFRSLPTSPRNRYIQRCLHPDGGTPNWLRIANVPRPLR